MNAPEKLPVIAADYAAVALPSIVRIAQLCPSPTNPRRTFRIESLEEMAVSIRRHGVLQPILVRPWPAALDKPGPEVRYEIVAGERRYRASVLAEVETIPATVRNLSDSETLEIQILENLQREEVHPLEEAEGYQVLMLRTGYTADQLAEKVGKSKSYIYGRLKLCAITGEAREAFLAGNVSASIALLIARIPAPGLQAQAAQEVMHGMYNDGPMSARRAAEHIQHRYMLDMAEAPFATGDKKLLAGAPACFKCPKLVANARDLYPDVKNADVCTDPDCYALKREAHIEQRIVAARALGLEVLEGQAAERLLPYASSAIESHTDLKGGWVQEHKTAYEAPWVDGKRPAWGALLGEAWRPTAVIVDAHRGQVVTLMSEADARTAAEAKGVTLRAASSASGLSEADKLRAKKIKAETAYRERLLTRLIGAAAGQALGPDELLVVATTYWEKLWHEYRKLIAKILVGQANHDGINEVTAGIGTVFEPSAILTACCLVNQVEPGYDFKAGAESARMLGFAHRLGVDAKAVRRECEPAGKPKPAVPAKGQAVKYQHPDDSSVTWTGRGKRPRWVADWLAGGGTLEDLQAVTA